MPQLETFSTDVVGARQRIAYWNDAACRTLTQLTAEPVDRTDFSGQIVRSTLGDIRIAEVSSDAASVYHSAAHIANERDAAYLILMQLKGSSIQRQNGRDVRLSEGGFTLFDCMHPYEMHFGESVTNLVLRVPRDCLRRYLAFPERVVAMPMLSDCGLTGVCSRLLLDVWRNARYVEDFSAGMRLGQTILDLIGASYLEVSPSQPTRLSAAAARRIRIGNYIETHFADPDLTPLSLAAHFQISPRYLHLIYRDESETVALYIRRRRLEATAHALTSSAQAHLSVSFIALQAGFNSVSHYCKVFKAEYGLSPGDYRRHAQDERKRVGVAHVVVARSG